MSIVDGEQRDWERDEALYFATAEAQVDSLVDAADLPGLLSLVHDDLLHWGAWLKRHLLAWFKDQEVGTAMGTIFPDGSLLGPLGLTRPIVGVGEVYQLLELAVDVNYATAFRKRFDEFWTARTEFLQAILGYQGPVEGKEYAEYCASADDQRSYLRKYACSIAEYVNLVRSWLRRDRASDERWLHSATGTTQRATTRETPPVPPDLSKLATLIRRGAEALAAWQSEQHRGLERINRSVEAIGAMAGGEMAADSPEKAQGTGSTAAGELKLRPCEIKVYGQWRQAVEVIGDCTDDETYDWVEQHNDDEPLPSRATWKRYVRNARRAHGRQKNTPRAARETGRSIVRGDEIEYQGSTADD